MWVIQAKSQRCMLLSLGVLALSVLASVSAHAIDVHPTAEQIQAAIDQGKAAARQHRPLDSLYVWFGVSDAVHPKGYLVTKLGGLSVLAMHMALRGLEPNPADVAQILDSKTMVVSAVIFGDTRDFAVGGYIVLEQLGKTVKPVTVRFDAQADRSAMWPESPKYKAKVVASFNYADFDPMAETTITVYPAAGGEASFSMKFIEVR